MTRTDDQPLLGGPRMKPYLDITDSSLARALAHPLRTRILHELEERTASPSEMASELDVPLGVVSYHMRQLAKLKLLRLVRREPRRGAIEHYYTARARPRMTTRGWRSLPTAIKHASLAAAVEELGRELNAAAAGGVFERAEAHLTRTPLTVDAAGLEALSREVERLLERAQKIEAASKARLARAANGEEQRAALVLMLYEPATSPTAGKRPPS
jgi:DNA-binding transcriptional ArsR family regulator